jgi:hypothetical protein
VSDPSVIKISLKLNSKSEKDPDLPLINIFVGRRRENGVGKLRKVGTGLLTFNISWPCNKSTSYILYRKTS